MLVIQEAIINVNDSFVGNTSDTSPSPCPGDCGGFCCCKRFG